MRLRRRFGESPGGGPARAPGRAAPLPATRKVSSHFQAPRGPAAAAAATAPPSGLNGQEKAPQATLPDTKRPGSSLSSFFLFFLSCRVHSGPPSRKKILEQIPDQRRCRRGTCDACLVLAVTLPNAHAGPPAHANPRAPPTLMTTRPRAPLLLLFRGWADRGSLIYVACGSCTHLARFSPPLSYHRRHLKLFSWKSSPKKRITARTRRLDSSHRASFIPTWRC